jgi:uncharacterized protein
MLEQTPDGARLSIAVVGTGISGLSAAWLLSKRHTVTIYEQADRLGGHSNTISVPVGRSTVPVDMGFIVFNRRTYPNLTALFEYLGVQTQPSDMSFAASFDDGDFEYLGGRLSGLFAQKRNLIRPRFWRMLRDIRTFYRHAVRHSKAPEFDRLTLGEYLDKAGYGHEFRNNYLLPMASAIWSCGAADIVSYSALAFIKFHDNHGLLQIAGQPRWETVLGGSISYVRRLLDQAPCRIKLDTAVVSVRRSQDRVTIADSRGMVEHFDHVVMANHADQALAALADPSPAEIQLLGSFRYQRNLAILHSDTNFMPRRRSAWASWNYLAGASGEKASFTYWMNRLQNIPDATPFFVTLNPTQGPRPETLHHSESYEHPVIDSAVIAAQSRLWELQGRRRSWYCGAYFGAGFHEDGLQAGLAVAEDLGGMRRPWRAADESGRIVRGVCLPPIANETVP